MTARLTTRLTVQALVRRVSAAGGSAMVLARGDEQAGAILVLALERGASARFWEMGLGPDGRQRLVPAGPDRLDDPETIQQYWEKRRRVDPDLWVIELDIAAAERFAAETIAPI